MFNADEIEAWAAEYPDAPDIKALVADIERDRALPQPGALHPASMAHMIAESRQRVLEKRAQALGFKPPVKELMSEIATETVKGAVLGASPLGGTRIGEALDKLPAPDAPSVAETEQKKAEKRRARGREVGFGFGGD